MKHSIKIGLSALSLALLSACGGGGDTVVVETSHAFLSVDNTAYGVVCVEDIFVDANSGQGQQVARDLVAYYGVGNPYANPLNVAYSAPTNCGGATENPVPAPNLVITADEYYNVIVPRVR